MPAPTEPGPRHIGGLWCTEVMERLPDYLDGELSEADRTAVEAHLRGCDWCAHFGGEYAQVVESVRERLGPAPAEPEVAERLARRLAEELD